MPTASLYADQPLALAIAPTRELALQVARELGWLYGPAGAQIATCVGGMDYRTERRALGRGAHIVVGTPGRLRDHIERGGLDLSGLSAAVVDEADEMLDLGFQEDLEFILAAAPPERRTLMFSATVPKGIERLATTYQKDALRVAIEAATSQHADIDYRAYSVAARDREHAIFNILRLNEAQTAIVFCKTRANVNHLLARMGNRGFPVVGLSGELSQTERTHALQALRDGRARVCIATDVAARGIDLPGLELVIHADLPGSSDTLLHRSGRTGRAGNKGTSALIVTPAEFKKAQRLLQGANVVAEWGAPPSAEEVQAQDDARLLADPALAEEPGEEAALAATLLDRFGPEQVAAAVIRLWRASRSAPEELTDPVAPPTPSSTAPRDRSAFGDSVWFVLNVGHTGRAEARWLLPKICEAGGIDRNAIGAIRVKQDQSFVQIATAQAGKFGETVELDRDLTMTRLEGEPAFDPAPRAPRRAPMPRPSREDRGPRPAKKPYAPKPRAAEEGQPAPAPRPRPQERPRPSPVESRAERKSPPREDRTERKPPFRKAAPDAPPRKAADGPEAEKPARKPRWKDGAPSDGKPRSAGFKSHGSKSQGFRSSHRQEWRRQEWRCGPDARQRVQEPQAFGQAGETEGRRPRHLAPLHPTEKAEGLSPSAGISAHDFRTEIAPSRAAAPEGRHEARPVPPEPPARAAGSPRNPAARRADRSPPRPLARRSARPRRCPIPRPDAASASHPSGPRPPGTTDRPARAERRVRREARRPASSRA